MNALLKPFLPYLIGIPILLAVGWALHRKGYIAGQAERTAYYVPLLADVKATALAAEARHAAQERESADVSAQAEERHHASEIALQARATAAESRITGLVQNLAAHRRCDAVPPTAGTAGEPESATEESARVGRVGSRITGTGAGCEADARTVLELQRWVADQRAVLNH